MPGTGNMFTKFLAIARNTFTETIRQPVYGLILLVIAGMLYFCIALAAFTMDDDNKLLREFGLSTLLMGGLFLAAFSASGILAGEIENKTVLTVISKPIGRAVFILGKFMGLVAALTAAFYLSTIVLLLLVRHGVMQESSKPYDLPVILFGLGGVLLALLIAGFCNYFYGMNFGSTAVLLAVVTMTIALVLVCLINVKWEIQPFGKGVLLPSLLGGVALVFMVVLMITAVAVAASTRLGQVMNLLVCLIVLMLGLTSDYLFGASAQGAGGSRLAAALYRVIPNTGLFWAGDAVSAKLTFSWGYLGMAAAYAGLYTLAALLVGMALFHRREVG
jgi:ABC-2 type transport system permease protein